MNRKGRVCSECVDGFAPSVISIGYECSSCTGAWYGVPLCQFLEFVPIIIFYFAILVFQISVTSAPMTCCMMYSQLAVILVLYTTLSHIFLLGRSNKNNSFWSPARISQKGPRHTIIIAFCLEYVIVMLLSMRSLLKLIFALSA